MDDLIKDFNESSKKRNGPIQHLVCIGTSTGGPKSLQKVLSGLPKGLAAPILIVQHMPPGFTQSLAKRLNELAKITVKEAEDGETLQNGIAYLAKGGYHMRVVPKYRGQLVIQLNNTSAIGGHRPSIDALLTSVAPLYINKVVVILTGMGSDGTAGIKLIKQFPSSYVIAESKESSVIFGMPKAAIESGYVDQIIHLDNIAEMITVRISTKGGLLDGK